MKNTTSIDEKHQTAAALAKDLGGQKSGTGYMARCPAHDDRHPYSKPPESLRFHAGLKHPSGKFFPAMIGHVTGGRDGTPRAMHRTFLSRDGTAKAGVEPNKMMLGPCRGCAVRLAPAEDVLMVGEGIETCLSAMQLMGLPAWAALSVGGMRSLVLPTGVKDVIVLADGDDAGEAAAQDCYRRWKSEGRRVRIMRAPWSMDFNDVLRKETAGPGGMER